ncbi:RNA-directed DNA polymerase [Pseudoruegeria sp. HB172150]|uniref:RNA-directed DNA polymerase n=1 Tax=Pseudoruegeria sp. HB172150 TaxID=2721164 RepID=UPI0015526DAA|nr:RNA-directed DNA polymerase [Pseudoruegeria sp. HB172150]
MSIVKGSKASFQRAIMEKGFYPENLPPAFKVRDFYSTAYGNGLLDSDQIERNKPLALSRYNETKRGGQRRIFSTPNPLFFIDVANYLGEYRAKLNPFLKRSNISRSIPVYQELFGRALKIESHAEFTRFRRSKLSTARYIIKTDISRFFPSIYTHSIPWAVHGKSASKIDRSIKSSGAFTNKLDYLVRQAQDQQTVGIPVGPDTSRIISELISSAIDEEFLKNVGSNVTAARLVDDIYIGAPSLEFAEQYLSSYRDAVRRYELDINESKTAIFEAKRDLEPFWPIEIRREIEGFSGRKPTSHLKTELTAYLDQIIRIANEENDDGIVKYAIRKMDERKLWLPYWDVLEHFLKRAAVNFPHCLDYVSRVVVWYNRRHGVETSNWANVCNIAIAYHAPQGNDSEVVWACWLLKEIKGKLHENSYKSIVNRCGPFSALLAVDLHSKGLVQGRNQKRLIHERLDDHPMLGNDWLLSYEAERAFDYRLKTKNRADYSVFGDLIGGGASFYGSGELPFVFQGIDQIEDVDEALEDVIGLYEDEGEDEDDVEVVPD